MMSQEKKQIEFFLSAVERRTRKMRKETVNELVGESYATMLESLSEAEAVALLKSVEESKLLGAYLVLSRRLPHAALAEVCQMYMKRASFRARLTGVGGVGIWLSGTRNAALSNLLATIVRDSNEHEAIRRAAYNSLELINRDETSASNEFIDEPCRLDRSFETWLDGVNWDYVDSFLLEKKEDQA